MDRRLFLTGMLGLAGAAAVASVVRPGSAEAGIPNSRGILDELDGAGEDVFDDGQEGFLMPPRDVETLCLRLEQLYRDGALRDEMARRAAERAKAWTWEDYGDAVVRTYERVFDARFGKSA